MGDKTNSHLLANGNLSKKNILVNNFIGGLAWGLGTVIGATIIVAILGYGLKAVGIFEPFQYFLEPANELKNSPPRSTK